MYLIIKGKFLKHIIAQVTTSNYRPNKNFKKLNAYCVTANANGVYFKMQIYATTTNESLKIGCFFFKVAICKQYFYNFTFLNLSRRAYL